MQKKAEEKKEFYNALLNKQNLKKVLYDCFCNYGAIKTARVADQIKKLSFDYATQSGISLSIEDLKVSQKKVEIIDEAVDKIEKINRRFFLGNITDVQRFQKIIATWNATNADLTSELLRFFRESDPLNPLYVMAYSGARGNISQVRQLVGMRGLMSDPRGQIIDIPIKNNFKDGLSVTEYIISSYGARKGLVDTALRTADSGYLTRRLVDVAQDVIVNEEDCGTTDFLTYGELSSVNKTASSGRLLIGRFLFSPIYSKENIQIAKKNQEITASLLEKIKDEIHQCNVRSPLTCKSTRSICSKCYGWDLAYAKKVNIGEAVGILAAQSIGEPGTQLTMRTFHTGGTFSASVDKEDVIFEKATKDIHSAAAGEVFIQSRESKERLITESKCPLSKGDSYLIWVLEPTNIKQIALVNPGQEVFASVGDFVQAGAIIAHDVKVPYSGKVNQISYSFVSIKIGFPHLVSKDGILSSKTGDFVEKGIPLAAICYDKVKTGDIAQGLPKVEKILEAQKIKNECVLSPCSGEAFLNENFIELFVDGKKASQVSINPGQHLTFKSGDYVEVGQKLTHGICSPHEKLKKLFSFYRKKLPLEEACRLSLKKLQIFLVAEVRAIYFAQDVDISEKHIEVIVKQMTSNVTIDNGGYTSMLPGEVITLQKAESLIGKARAKSLDLLEYSPILLGISKASLNSDSFFSAASFQETTRVLTEAAIEGKTDWLRGIKENVIVGRLVPAGTGFKEAPQKTTSLGITNRESSKKVDLKTRILDFRIN